VSGALAALFPVVVLIAGIAVMNARPEHKAIARIVPPVKALNLGPYDAVGAKEHWAALAAEPGVGSQTALDSERIMLRIDLLFPLFYGGAFAASLWSSARGLGYANPVTLLVPVLLMMVADWTENGIQLAQLSRFDASGEVSEPWITAASVATCMKLALVGGLLLLNGIVGVRFACGAPHP
jgi:hypothetical protein